MGGVRKNPAEQTFQKGKGFEVDGKGWTFFKRLGKIQ